MPELPEVETVLRGIAPALSGARITQARINRPDLRWPFPEQMAERLTGARIDGLWRRSKYILCDLDRGESLLVHLGMSGRILISGDPQGRFVFDHPLQEKHDHVILDFDNGTRLTFNDPRRFGAMDLLPRDNAAAHPLLARIGPEPLGNEFHGDYLIAGLSTRKSPIKTALLDQRLVAGLGNIYVCEALFRAHLHPATRACDIARDQIHALAQIIIDVLREAIEAGGSPLKDYRQADGKLGYFQHSFDVYGRENAPCRRRGCTGEIARLTQSGRSSFYCPQCQR